MAEEETRALIVRYLEAFNASDSEAMLACLDEDVAHDTARGERQIGKEKFRWAHGERARHYSESLEDIAVMTAPGGIRAAAEFTVRGRYLATEEGLPVANGQSYAVPGGMFFEVDDGLITRVTTYYDLNDFVAQVSKAE
ncbi:ketosteroid isomerase-related protein [Oricola cellulosilytica]|uniref:Cytosolic protein n=1 Tax=Oricola cellulosilytica TaxID=1429082 RepID=A0A4R0P8V6_9HYPH|nr:cytosolic protein [Oricola cellulosilytica]